MKINKLFKYIFLLTPILLTSCAKEGEISSNIYKDLDARKMLFFNLENIKRNEEDKISNYTNKITYKYTSGEETASKTYRSESNIYSNYLESTGIAILSDKSTITNNYKHAIRDDYLYSYSLENGELETSKSMLKGSEQDSYNLVNSTYLKYDFLSNVQKSSVDLVESILLLPDSSFNNLNFLDSSSSNDSITFEIKDDNKYEYTLLRKSKSKVNEINYELNLSILSKMYLNDNKMYSYTINYNYSLIKGSSDDNGKDGASNEINDDVTFSLELSGNSKYERKDAKDSQFEFINLVNSN